MLTELGLDPAKLPAPRRSTDIAGRLSAPAAAELGLRAGIPVCVGGGDGACASAGAGAVAGGDAYCCLGTTAWITRIGGDPVLDEQRRLFSLIALDGETCGTYGTVQCAGRAMEWARELFGISDFAQFNALASQVPAGSEGLLFLPYLEGERSPMFDPDARGVYFGLSTRHGRAHLVRAAMEGVCFALATVLSAIREHGPVPALRLIGGGGQSALLQQIFADAADVEIRLLSVPAGDATALGAAIAAGVGVGIFPDFASATRGIRMEQTRRPDSAVAGVYRRRLELYQSLYPALRPAFAALRGDERRPR